MRQELTVGLPLGALASLALAYSFYAEHKALSPAPTLVLTRPLASLAALFRNVRWLAGYATGLVGWGLYIAALRFAPLSVTQAIVAGGVGVIALLRWRGGGLDRREVAATVAVGFGMACLLVSLLGSSDLPRQGGGSLAQQTAWILSLCAIAALVAGPFAKRLRPGAGLAACAGSLYAAGDIATKTAFVHGDPLVLLAVPVTVGIGFVALQLSFQRGVVTATASVATVLGNVLPIAAGIVAFGELPRSATLAAVRLAALVLVAIGGAALATRVSER